MGGGGAERQLSYLAAPLSDRGWTVVTVLVDGGPYLPRLMAGGARVEWLRTAGNHDPRALTGLRKLIWREAPDLVHSWLPQMDVLAGLATIGSGVPWMLSERNDGFSLTTGWKGKLLMMLAKRAAMIVANSRGGGAVWEAHAPSVPVRVVPNGIDIEAIDSAVRLTAEQSGIPESAKVILAVGRCTPGKNLRLLIEALPKLERDVVGVVCGEGPLLEELRDLASRLGVADRVRFPGFVDSIWSWMKRADALVSPSLFEGVPNAVLEAFAARRPVVLSDTVAHRESFSDEVAVFVNPHSSVDLADAMRTVFAGVRVQERLACARAYVERLSIESMGAAYDALYRSILRAGPGNDRA